LTIFARVAGTGSSLPDRILTNQELESMVDTSDEWIQSRTGISERRIAAEGETTCDLAEKASLNAMDAAGVDPLDIDLVVLATTTPDQVFPSTACLLQERLKISNNSPAFDVQAVCSGFIYALDLANKFITGGNVKCALVVGAETFSRIIDWTDRNTCVLFGDGAGAVVLKADQESGITSSILHANGAYNTLLHVPHGVSKGFDRVQAGGAFTQMQGSEVFKFAVRALGDIVDEVLEKEGLSKNDIDWLVPHQANIRIISASAKRLGISLDKVIVTIERHGNTSAASVPLAFDEAVREGKIKRGQRVIMEALGGGFTWGAVLMVY
jgi:3-oxoacyl-[acyl-carrier-protein] synthase-3|tara:strand:+ start:252 stop:1226 length:975 start_codon:yes stop_codon:yes gene_type:complete